ncbi:MAG: ArgE/DapE family deacylase [Acidobacteria bacterium]|nr:ArgE/DapE family deacylase [Acidobacteriota bacterium]
MMRKGLQELLSDAVAKYQPKILEFARSLVAVPTVNPPGASYKACIDRIARELSAIGLEHEIVEAPDAGAPPRYSLSSFYGRGKRTLYFHGHYDVAPASGEGQFQPYLRNGSLFGRGSSDMKSGLAAMIYAVKTIKDCGLKLDGRIGLAIVPDEETGGALGSTYLAARGLLGVNGIGMLTPEPTSGVVWNANRGAISLRITVRGRPAHVGLHYRGVNAFERMVTVANALQELKAEVESRKTAFQIEPEAARRSILLLGGRCEGGTNFNAVPASCSFTVDRRLNPEEDLETEKRRLLALLERLKRDGIDLEVEILQEALSAGASEEDPVARELAQSVKAVTGRAPRFEICPGLLEIRYYAHRGIPAFAYGPGRLEVSHGPREFVRMKDVYACTVIYALVAARVLSSR